MTGNDVFLVDTNILVYYFDKTEAEKHGRAKRLIDHCLDREVRLAVSTQNLSEFFSVVVSKKLLPKSDARRFIADVVHFNGFEKLTFDHRTVLDAALISEKHEISYWDALLAATMKQHGVLNLYTENAKDFPLPWLYVVDPFSRKNNLT